MSGGEDRLKVTKECVGGKEVDTTSINNLVKKLGSVGKREIGSQVARGELKACIKAISYA